MLQSTRATYALPTGSRGLTIWKVTTVTVKLACAFFPLSRPKPVLRGCRFNADCPRNRHADLRLQQRDDSRSLCPTRCCARAARSSHLLRSKSELESRYPEVARWSGRRFRHCVRRGVVSRG